MSLAEQIAQLRKLLTMSSEARVLDLLFLNIIEELHEAVAALRDGDQPRGFGSI
jgi:hypothetical protein